MPKPSGRCQALILVPREGGCPRCDWVSVRCERPATRRRYFVYRLCVFHADGKESYVLDGRLSGDGV